MNSTDLANMFKEYVTGYQAGTDDVVEKFFGKHEENSGGIEAELDIQARRRPGLSRPLRPLRLPTAVWQSDS